MKTAIALGSFDGLHAGHRAVLRETLDCHAVAVTFRVPPKAAGKTGCLLMMPEDKISALKSFGMAEIDLLDFETVREQQPEEFLTDLAARYHPARLVCGYNYRFGKNAAGTTELLAAFCRKNGIELRVVERVNDAGKPVSSTDIRNLLSAGKPEEANRLLYRDFCFSGKVLHGDERGRKLGFPTANQQYPTVLVPLKKGVYAVTVERGKERYHGVANIGIRPTFENGTVLSETHLFDFSGDLYGEELTVYPKRFVRPEQRFSSETELKKAVLRDLDFCKSLTTD